MLLAKEAKMEAKLFCGTVIRWLRCFGPSVAAYTGFANKKSNIAERRSAAKTADTVSLYFFKIIPIKDISYEMPDVFFRKLEA